MRPTLRKGRTEPVKAGSVRKVTFMPSRVLDADCQAAMLVALLGTRDNRAIPPKVDRNKAFDGRVTWVWGGWGGTGPSGECRGGRQSPRTEGVDTHTQQQTTTTNNEQQTTNAIMVAAQGTLPFTQHWTQGAPWHHPPQPHMGNIGAENKGKGVLGRAQDAA